jgi:hypothetical protein
MDTNNSNQAIDSQKAKEFRQKYLQKKELVVANLKKMIQVLEDNEQPIHGENRKELFRLMKLLSEIDMPDLDYVAFEYFSATNPMTEEELQKIKQESRQDTA